MTSVHLSYFKYTFSGDEYDIRAEKEYETAAAKGLRPCLYFLLLCEKCLTMSLPGPTCKQMNDLSAAKIFKSSAFEPSDEELTGAAKARRKQRSRVKHNEFSSDDDIDVATPPPKTFTGSKFDLDDSSDEEMPDVADLFAGCEGNKKVKEEVKQSMFDMASAAIEDVSPCVLLRVAF
jgi:hypothetical protein